MGFKTLNQMQQAASIQQNDLRQLHCNIKFYLLSNTVESRKFENQFFETRGFFEDD